MLPTLRRRPVACPGVLPMFHRRLRGLAALALACSTFTAGAQVAIDGAVQNFDTLATASTSSTLPAGWFISESGTNANATYAAGDGSSNSGNTYSFGTGTNAER